MFEHVLVPLDGSSLAEEALQYLNRTVCSTGTITLLRVVDVPERFKSEAGADKLLDSLSVQAQAYLDTIAHDLRASGLIVKTKVYIGDAAELIVESAQKLGIDVIVMSTHGLSGLSQMLFGSVTGKVLRERSCPVLVIPNQHEAEKSKPDANVVDVN